jgi:hypothetical protein
MERSVPHLPAIYLRKYIPRVIIRRLPYFGLHLSIIHHRILHLSHPGLKIVKRQVRDRFLQAVKIHDGRLVMLFEEIKIRNRRRMEGRWRNLCE